VTVLIDPPTWPAHGRRWSHLVSDVSFTELHAFARALHLPPRGFEGDHYDVPEERYHALVAAGAVPVSCRELLQRLGRAGLRRRKRRGERVLSSHRGADGRWVDVLASRLPPVHAVRGRYLVVGDHRGILAVRDCGIWRLPYVRDVDPWLDADVASDADPGAAGHGWSQLGYLRHQPHPPREQPTRSGRHDQTFVDLVLHRMDVVDVVGRPSAEVPPIAIAGSPWLPGLLELGADRPTPPRTGPKA
jgi:Protein of unknown function (DUF4031)